MELALFHICTIELVAYYFVRNGVNELMNYTHFPLILQHCHPFKLSTPVIKVLISEYMRANLPKIIDFLYFANCSSKFVKDLCHILFDDRDQYIRMYITVVMQNLPFIFYFPCIVWVYVSIYFRFSLSFMSFLSDYCNQSLITIIRLIDYNNQTENS